MWAVMAWLQILAKKTEAAGKLVSVEDKKTKNGGNEIIYSEAHQCLQLQLATKMLLSKSCGAARRLVLLYRFLDMTFLRKVNGVNSTSMVTLHGMMLGQC